MDNWLELIKLIENSKYKLLVYGTNEIIIAGCDGSIDLVFYPEGENQCQQCIDWMKEQVIG